MIVDCCQPPLPPIGAMVSRRKILSRSRDELHSDIYYMAENDDDDVWYSKEKLYAVRISSLYRETFQDPTG